MRPVCVGCSTEMRMTAMGILVRFSKNKYFSGDKYECPSCGSEVITSFGNAFHSTKEDVRAIDLRD